MKKHYWIITGFVLMSVPVVSTVGMRIRNNRNSMIVFPSINVSLGSYQDKFDSFIGNQNNKVCGELESVTYYAKTKDKNERLLLFLNSNTLSGEDYCFLVVSVYASDGSLDYRLETTKVEFKGLKYHEIEIGEPKNKNETNRLIKVATTFYSNPNDQHQLIEFNVKTSLNKEYVFEDNKNFKSLSPVRVEAFNNGEIKEYYEEFQFLSFCNYKNKKPIFNVNDLSFIYNYEKVNNSLPYYDECYLLIDSIYDKSDFEEENELKKVPLELEYFEGVIHFKLKNKYYYDSGDGMVYQNNQAGRNQINNLVLPATYDANSAVYYEIHLNGFSAAKSDLVFKSYASFEYKWFGQCDTSLFCIESVEELIDDPFYSGGVTV